MEIIARAIMKEEEMKDTQIIKEEVKLCLFTNDMVLYAENQEDLTPKLLELINVFKKFAKYKINIQNY